MKHYHSHTKGFSIIEAVVAVTLLSVAAIGPMTLVSQSLRATREARLELAATHLAEEGIEIVHNIRDNNSAHETDLTARSNWLDNPASISLDIINECGNGGFGCIPDVTEHPGVAGVTGGGGGIWTTRVLEKCNGVCDKRVFENPGTGLYRQKKAGLTSPWVATPFERIIYVTGVDHPSNPVVQARLVSEVSYRSFTGATRTIRVSEDLYNWFPNLN